MRTKKAIYNNLTAGILQVVTLIFGLILPRLMIEYYGSEMNGLVSSTKQIVSYLKYLEFGISYALIFSLYKPISDNNYNEINPLITRTKKEYTKISLLYFIGVIILSLIYPFLLKEDLGFSQVAILVFIIGIYGALDLYSLAKYRVFLEANQKAYVISLISIIAIIIQNILTIILIVLKQSILIVTIVPILVIPIRSIYLNLYIKRNYKQIKYDEKPSKVKLTSRSDAFISGISNSLNVSFPIIVVSLVVSLEMASVFSIYSMVYIGLVGVIYVFISGLRSAFGNMYARGEMKNFAITKNYYEFILYFILAVIYSAALGLIIPFVSVYVKGVADINYIYPTFGILFTIWSVFHNSRLPNITIINATGKWRLITKTNIIQMIILIVGTITLGYIYGIEGILVGMIISSVYKLITIMIAVNNNILNESIKRSLIRLARIFIVVFLSNIPLLFKIVEIEANNLLDWMIIAMGFTVWSFFVTTLVNMLFEFKTIKEIYNRYFKKLINKWRKRDI